ncbi:MAG: aminomethyltransferase [Myxococcota bacterium]|jgi:aminomethyltransferase
MGLRRTPFHALHVEAGARMVPFAGFEMPVQYTGVGVEHATVRERAGLFDVSHMGEVRVRGSGAEMALQRLLSNGILRLRDGRAQYNAMCNTRGGVVDDVFVYRIAADDFMVCVNAANREKDFAWMLEHASAADVHLEDEGDAWAQLAVQGPAAVRIVDALTEGVALAEVKRHGFVRATFAGIPGCLVARTGYTGEDGFEVFLPAHLAEPAWGALLTEGAGAGLAPIGLGARDTLRLEAGNCLYGHELTDDTSPIQAGLGWITKLRKPGGFVGSDAIAARSETDTRKLVRLVMQGKRIPREGMDVLLEGERVGVVTSGTKGPTVGRGIALAYVDNALGTPGTELVIDVRGRPEPADVIDGAFYRRG